MRRAWALAAVAAALQGCATAPDEVAVAPPPYDACYDARVVARVAKVLPVFTASGSRRADDLVRTEPAVLLEVRRVAEGPVLIGPLDVRGQKGVVYRPGDQSTYWLREYERGAWEINWAGATAPGPKCAGFSRPG